nr:hypothetical protein [Tanacetum cinerariifolium]
MQTQTSNTLHNAIMEAGSKDRLPMLAPGNYVQWKSRIKKYIDTKPNHELIHYCLKNPPYELGWKDKEVPTSEGSLVTRTERVNETYKNVSQDIRDQLNAEAEAGESINDQDLETNLYWEFGKVTSQDGETLESYYLRFYKMMNELIRNQCKVTNHQVNVKFLLQLQPEWQRFVTLVKQSQELKTVSYHKLYDILKQHQYEVNEIRAEKIAHDETSKDKEIDKIMALTSLSFKKIYKPTNNNLRTSSNTSRANQDNSLWINRNAGYDNQRNGTVHGARETIGSSVVQKSSIQCYNCKEFRHVARECHKPKRAKDAAYHREKMLLSNNKLSETNNLLYADYKKSKAELAKRNSKEYASQMELECAKVREMKDKLYTHQETISILSKQKEAQIKLYKTREDKELDKVIELENKVKVLDNIVYKTNQSVQTMNMLNKKCRTSFAKPEFLKKAQRANPRLYDIGCYNDNLVLMLTPDYDEVIRLEKESRSNLSDLIRLFDYDKLNNLRISAGLNQFLRCLNEEMVADLTYFNSLESEVDSLRSQLETQKT